MMDFRTVLQAGTAFFWKVAGHAATSVVTALCAALVTNAVIRKEDPAPSPLPVAQDTRPLASAAPTAPPAWGGQRSPASPDALAGLGLTPVEPAHAFPLDGAPTFQPSLSRPFVALAGSTWAEARSDGLVRVADDAPAQPRKPTPRVAAKPAKPAMDMEPVVARASVPADEPDPTPPPSAAPRSFPAERPPLVPPVLATVDRAVSGVTSMASNLTRLAGLP